MEGSMEGGTPPSVSLGFTKEKKETASLTYIPVFNHFKAFSLWTLLGSLCYQFVSVFCQLCFKHAQV